MILRVILWVLLAYFIYKFLFDLVLPLFKVTRQMKQQVKNFHQHAQQQDNQQQASAEKSQAPKTKSGEYIEFEEVKK